MGNNPRDSKLSLNAEILYLDLMYCRADAQLGDMPYVVHLLNLACEELQKLAEAAKRGVPAQPDWNAFHIFPDMK
jgi:hypothetical protein